MKQQKLEEKKPKMNELQKIYTRRSNGTMRVQLDFSACPTLTEQHTGHLTDLNYLIKKYRPDELAAYISAKTAHRREIIGHDFSVEPDLQEGKNKVYEFKKAFEGLPEEIRTQFKNHVEYLKFIDNPANQKKMIKLGLMTKKQIEQTSTDSITTTKEEAEVKEKK